MANFENKSGVGGRLKRYAQVTTTMSGLAAGADWAAGCSTPSRRLPGSTAGGRRSEGIGQRGITPLPLSLALRRVVGAEHRRLGAAPPRRRLVLVDVSLLGGPAKSLGQRC